jgi:hypothetical protein
MSRCIDLFIDAPVGLDELAALLGRLIGIPFVGAVEGSQWVLRDGDVAAVLAEHRFDDDRHLLLKRYRYDLFARTDAHSALDSPETELLRRVFAAIRADGTYPALLVFDLQHALDQVGAPGAAEASS